MRRAALTFAFVSLASVAFAACNGIVGDATPLAVDASDAANDAASQGLGDARGDSSIAADAPDALDAPPGDAPEDAFPEASFDTSAPDAACASGVLGDKDNCGRCGHGCLGGACNAGVCEAVPIVLGQQVVTGLVDAGDSICWALFYDFAVRCISKTAPSPCDGLECPSVAAGNPASSSTGLIYAPSIQRLFWGNQQDDGNVMRADTAGASVDAFAMHQGSPVAFAIDAGMLYWINRTTGAWLTRQSLSGGAPEYLATGSTTANSGATTLMIHGAYAYWSGNPDDGSHVLRRTALAGTGPRCGTDDCTWLTLPDYADSLAATDTSLFLAISGGGGIKDGAIYELSPDCTQATASTCMKPILANAWDPTRIIADNGTLYWIEHQQRYVASTPIGHPCDEDLGTCPILARSTDVISNLMITADSIYYATINENDNPLTSHHGTIWRLAR